ERLQVSDLAAVDHVADGQLHDLATPGPRNVTHLHDLGRNVARCRVAADVVLDLLDKVLIECASVAQAHEQHDPVVAVPTLRDDKAFEHLVELLYLPIYLGGYNAHP